jgi:hypothetical protein
MAAPMTTFFLENPWIKRYCTKRNFILLGIVIVLLLIADAVYLFLFPPLPKSVRKLQPCPNPQQTSAEGRKGLCARCHAPVLETNANSFGKRYWQLPIYKLDVIGTDTWDATGFGSRVVYTGALKDTFGAEKVGIGQALGVVIPKVMERQYKETNVPPDAQVVWNGFRDSAFRGPAGYPARPLDGYWATPPFLHNNSVPNLYQLLSPVGERQKSFWVGDLEYDPHNVGYQTDAFPGGFEFKTRYGFLQAAWNSFLGIFRGEFSFQRDIDGNSNAGHEFRDAPKGTKELSGNKRIDF